MNYKYKILYADDVSALHDMIKEVLANFNIEIISAFDGIQALKLLRKEKFDLLLTSINMPNMNGLELIKKTRKLLPNIPIIIFSGYSSFQGSLELINYGIAKFIQKPCDTKVLHDAVFEALEQNRKNIASSATDSSSELSLLRRVILDNYLMPRFGLLAGGISHNLKSPLSGIMGYAQILYMKNPDMKGLQVIDEQSQKLNEYLIMLGEKGQSEVEFNYTDINLRELVERETRFLNFNHFFRHQVETKIDLNPTPAFKGIYQQIARVFHHLMQNALDAIYYINNKKLFIKTEANPDNVSLTIKDTGAGIPPENMDKIFQPGFTTKPLPSQIEEPEAPSGYGLGLYVVREILKQYNTHLKIDSLIGRSTTATVTFHIKDK